MPKLKRDYFDSATARFATWGDVFKWDEWRNSGCIYISIPTNLTIHTIVAGAHAQINGFFVFFILKMLDKTESKTKLFMPWMMSEAISSARLKLQQYKQNLQCNQSNWSQSKMSYLSDNILWSSQNKKTKNNSKRRVTNECEDHQNPLIVPSFVYIYFFQINWDSSHIEIWNKIYVLHVIMIIT